MALRNLLTFFTSSPPNHQSQEEIFFDVELNEEEPLLLMDEEKFLDAEPTEDTLELAEVIIESSQHTDRDQKPQKFLADEINACIKLLEEAKKNIKVNTDKLNEAHYYYRRILITQNAMGLVTLLAGLVPVGLDFNNEFKLKNIINNQLFNELKSSENALEANYTNVLNLGGSARVGVNAWLETSLIERHKEQYFFWKSDVCGNLREAITHSPIINAIFCYLELTRQYKREEDPACSSHILTLCYLENSIKNELQTPQGSQKYLQEYINYLNAQYEVSNMQLEIHRTQAKLHAPSLTSGLIAGGVTLAVTGCMAYFYKKFIQAYRAYKEDLLHADDVDRCLVSPQLAERIINLTSRFDIPLTNKKIDTLIDELKQKASEVHARRRVRLAFMSFFSSENNEHQVPKDVGPHILRFAGLSPEQQAPRSSLSKTSE